LSALGYIPALPVKVEDFVDAKMRQYWYKQKNTFVFTFHHPHSFYQIDIFIENPINFSSAFKQKKSIKLPGFSIPLANIKDLIRLKKKAGRKQDFSDIEMLRKIMRGFKS